MRGHPCGEVPKIQLQGKNNGVVIEDPKTKDAGRLTIDIAAVAYPCHVLRMNRGLRRIYGEIIQALSCTVIMFERSSQMLLVIVCFNLGIKALGWSGRLR